MYFLVLPQQSSLLNLYGPVLFRIPSNTGKIAPAARALRRIHSFGIVLLGTLILRDDFFEIDNVCIMTQVGIYSKI